MTYKEAKDILRVAAAEVEWNCPLDYTEAFKKAEEALDKQITKTTEKLKPCPFCGGEAKMLKMGGIKGMFFNPTVKRPTCTKCHATMFVWFNEQTAIRAWNRRIDNG